MRWDLADIGINRINLEKENPWIFELKKDELFWNASIESVKSPLCWWVLVCKLMLQISDLRESSLPKQSLGWGKRDKLQLSLLRYSCALNGCAWNFLCVLDTRNVRELAHWDVNSESVRVFFSSWTVRSLAQSVMQEPFCSALCVVPALMLLLWGCVHRGLFTQSHSLFHLISKLLCCLSEIRS